MLYFHSWSGGKDSTASVILDHIHGLPPSKIIFSEVMFDKKRGISGELPEHIDFVMNRAKPLFEEWGYTVEILHSDRDYLDLFFQVTQRSKKPERNGKLTGFLLGGMCYANPALKLKPIRQYLKSLGNAEYTQYIGIAVDEPKRLERLKGTNRVSLLERFGYTEQMAFELCKEYDLLSPTYQHGRRGGCWFCPNQNIKSFARLKTEYPELWGELRELSKTDNLISKNFSYKLTFAEVEAKVDQEIERQKDEAAQITLFDLL